MALCETSYHTSNGTRPGHAVYRVISKSGNRPYKSCEDCITSIRYYYNTIKVKFIVEDLSEDEE